MNKKQGSTHSLLLYFVLVLPTHSLAEIVTTGEVFPTGLDTLGDASATFVNVGGNDITPGTGTLLINGGSILTTPEPLPFGAIGRLDGSNGTATVTGTSSTWRIEGTDGTFGAFLHVGRGGVGILNVLNDGKVIIDGLGADISAFNGGMWVGRQTTTPGSTLNISGSSSEVRIVNMDHTFFSMGRDADATVNVTNGGSLIVDGNNDLISLRNGTMNINTGGLVQTEIFNVAALENDVVTINLEGDTSRIHVTGVGDFSSGGYNNERYGGFMTIGGRTGAVAVVNVTDGAQINIDDGTGTAADGAIARGAGFSLGGNPTLGFGGEGTLNVDGKGSMVTVSTANNQGEFVGIGRTQGGGGTVNVKNGGQVIIENNPALANPVQGDGVQMATNADSGTAILNVSGEDADGNASLFDAGRFLGVGVDNDLADTAKADVSTCGGGTVKAEEIAVGSGGTISGDGTLIGNVIVERGNIDPGCSPGTLTVDGNLEMNDGVLKIEVAGTDPDQYDVLNITGNADLTGGTILFSFVDGFLPQQDDPLLEFVTAGGVLTVEPDVNIAFEGVDESFELAVSHGGMGLSFDALNDALPPSGIVLIDIKPHNKRNVINPRSRGRIWVAILSDARPFDPLQINIRSVGFGSNGAKAIRHRVRDVNRDGLPDLLLQFKVRKTGIACGDSEAILTGETWSGDAFTGTDSVKTVGCRYNAVFLKLLK